MCKAFEETRNEGYQMGRAEGRAEGRTEGIIEQAITSAKRMLARGKMPLEEISEYTQLTLDKVKELAATMKA